MEKLLPIVVVLAFTGTGPALAAPHDKWIEFQFGGTAPAGEFGESARIGLVGGIAGTYMDSDRLGVGVDVAYHAWGRSDPVTLPFVGPSTSDVDAIQATMHLLYAFRPGPSARPYVRGGFGICAVKATLDTPLGRLDGSREIDPDYHAGAGLRYRLSPAWDLAIGGAFHVIQYNGPDAKFFAFGVNFMRRLGAN